MTIKEAIKARLYPYVLPDSSIEVLVLDQDLDMEDEYEKDAHERAVAQVEVNCLWQVITLKKEQDNGSTQEYDLGIIKDRIYRLARKYGLDDELQKYAQNEDITDCW